MKLSIITLTYNKLEFTKKYIDSLYKYTSDFELIIIDNGSTDGTVEFIRSLPHKNIKTIFNSENLGFSKGNNQGIEIAEGEYIGFLNNDILLYPNWFIECEKVFQKENAAFVSPLELQPRFHNVNKFNYHKYFKKQKFKNKYEKSFDKCQLACAITKQEILNKIGTFDENYTPAFFEDNDIKYRAIEAGYDTFFTNTVCFFHYSSVTSKDLNSNFENNRKYYYSKCRFAEYLSLYANENYDYAVKSKFFEGFPWNIFYYIHLLFKKVIRNIIRMVKS